MLLEKVALFLKTELGKPIFKFYMEQSAIYIYSVVLGKIVFYVVWACYVTQSTKTAIALKCSQMAIHSRQLNTLGIIR
jgi:hypothetical protein